jgi:hypothetical protein
VKRKALISRSFTAITAFLRAKAPQQRVISIAFVEVDQQKTAPQSYALSSANRRSPFDYVWFTRADDEHRCEKFKSQLDRMKTQIERRRDVTAAHPNRRYTPPTVRFSGVVSFVITLVVKLYRMRMVVAPAERAGERGGSTASR